MNDAKLKKLFEAARDEAASTPPEDFESQVLRAVRNESRVAPSSFWDQIEALFPRLVIASLLVAGLCIFGDYCYSTTHPGGLVGDVTNVADQWLLGANESGS